MENHIVKINKDISLLHNAVKEKFSEIDIRLQKIEKSILIMEQYITKINISIKKQGNYLKQL
jgi:AAA+ superfamily predicted ATPase